MDDAALHPDKSEGPAPARQSGEHRRILSGVEAIVELLAMRARLDRQGGLKTGTMVSGYPGSPLGGLDLVIEARQPALDNLDIHHQPGVNEELALAAVWGSQMGRAIPYSGFDGVAGVWYGKTPGLDRCGDVLRHANAMGAGPNGGAVLFCGDDPTAKSSTFACERQYAFMDVCVPVLVPGNQQELVDLGLHAFRMSRAAGPLVGIKVVTAVADGTGLVDLDPGRFAPFDAALTVAGQPWRHQPLATIGPHQVPGQELLVSVERLEAAKAYALAHGLDRVLGAAPGARLGVVCTGKTYYDLVQALAEMGVAPTALGRLGVRVLKLGMTYPLVDQTVRDFARSVDLVAVIEEKRPFIESQLRAILHEAGVVTPVAGKRDRDGRPLVSQVGELDSDTVAAALIRLLPDLAGNRRVPVQPTVGALQPPPRPPAFCSGCPHNRSTLVPEGALAGGGVGCHGIFYFEARQAGVRKLPPPPMGAEGVPWIGLAPFVDEPHLIQNIGDGTLSHSGILAIRASVAAGANTTFKILYNSAVAMTGGQAVEGQMDVPALTRALEAEGVRRVVVCAADPERYGAQAHWAPGCKVLQRDELARTQEELRQVPGVTAIVYDQVCATEARRLRKRGQMATPPAHVFINPAVCEGCGDCTVKSNCASVQPLATEFGDKRRIDDPTCNRDYSCLEGDCPSFVTIIPSEGKQAKPARRWLALPQGDLPAPQLPQIDGQFGVYFTGIGGTGVVTAARLIANAAVAAGLTTSGLDQTGLAQKGGAVASHLRLARSAEDLGSPVLGGAGADLYLSGDIFQAAAPTHLGRMAERAVAVIESDITPTAAMLQAGIAAPSEADLQAAVTGRIGEGTARFLAARDIAEGALGDPVFANVVLLGAAFQLGGVPIPLAAFETAIAAQGKIAEANRRAFDWGRWAVQAPEAVAAVLQAGLVEAGQPGDPFAPSAGASDQAGRLAAALSDLLPPDLAALVERRTAQAIDYQDDRVAERYLALVTRAIAVDRAEQDWALTRALAQGWHKLLTYKDEYEVARLHRALDYDAVARSMGISGGYDLRYHLSPEQARSLGFQRKLVIGRPAGWLFAVLRRLKRLRGTPFDPFGMTTDRRLERAVAVEYESAVRAALDAGDYLRALAIASSAQMVRGYGPVKRRNIAAWREHLATL